VQDGTYRLYPLSTATPQPYSQHSLGPDANDAGVVDANIYEEGMVVLLGSLHFVEVKGWEKEGAAGGRVTRLANAGLDDRPRCWCVIRPELSSSRGVEVVICTDKTVLRLDEIECLDQVRSSLVGDGFDGCDANLTPPPSPRVAAHYARPFPSHQSFTKRQVSVGALSTEWRESPTLGCFV